MKIRYYFSIFPMEALVASHLEPRQFGAYMATGSKKGSSELLIFSEVEPHCCEAFDWDYAEKNCVPHENGDPKHSLYLSVYRVLEHIPLKAINSIYLTTRDGRTLQLEKSTYTPLAVKLGFFIYQELCPITPVVLSMLQPFEFAQYLTKDNHKIHVPKVSFCDLKIPKIITDESVKGNTLLDKRTAHLLECISSISGEQSSKTNKTLDRSHVESFSFHRVLQGFYIGDGTELLSYKMPNKEEIKKIDYDWGRSALIL